MRNPTERVPFWRSIQVKFALTYILIVAAVLSLLNTYPLLVSRDLVITSKETSLQSQAGFIAGALAVSETLTEEGVEQAMEDLGPMTFNRIMITGPTGLVLYDTEEVGNARGHYALLWEITTALRDTGNDVFRCEYRDGAFRSWAVAPVVYRNMVIGAVYLHERDTEQASLLLGIQNNLRNISFMICAVALVMSVIVSGAITRRIAALLRAIQECGSVLGACERLELSYSKGRAILHSAEQELGFPLVRRTKGGVGGGSASLTEAGVRLLDSFEQYQADVRRYAQEHFDALRTQLEHPE